MLRNMFDDLYVYERHNHKNSSLNKNTKVGGDGGGEFRLDL